MQVRRVSRVLGSLHSIGERLKSSFERLTVTRVVLVVFSGRFHLHNGKWIRSLAGVGRQARSRDFFSHGVHDRLLLKCGPKHGPIERIKLLGGCVCSCESHGGIRARAVAGCAQVSRPGPAADASEGVTRMRRRPRAERYLEGRNDRIRQTSASSAARLLLMSYRFIRAFSIHIVPQFES